jgi:predicted kinase
MKIIALAGPPGAGKTYHRDTTPDLVKLPFFDVAEVYADYPGIEPADAFSELLNRITEFAGKDNAKQDIVVEAMFKEESIQRTWLGYIGEANGYAVEYINFDTPLETCVERVDAHWKKSSQSLADRVYHTARKQILQALIANEQEHENNKRSKLERDRRSTRN